MSGVLDSKIIWGLTLAQPKREVLRAYLDCANEDGMSNPGIQQIAWMTDYHIRHVQRITHALEQDGLLIATPRAGKTTEYRFNLSAVEQKPALGEGVTNVTPDTIMSPHEMSPLTPNVTPDISTPDIQVSPPDAPAVSSTINLLGNSQEQTDKSFKNKNTTAGSANAPAREESSSGKNPYALYADNIGELKPVMAEKLKDAVKEYSAEWVYDAILEAIDQNIPRWSYIIKILVRWKLEGKNAPRPAAVSGKPRASPVQQPQPQKPVLSPTSRGAPSIEELKRARTSEDPSRNHAREPGSGRL